MIVYLERDISCAIMGLQFVAASGLNTGGPEVTLTCPRTTESIQGDGNCFFVPFPLLSRVVNNSTRWCVKPLSATCFKFHISCYLITSLATSVSEYIQRTCMDHDCTWGTDIEIFTLAHLLNTFIFVYTTEQCNWWRYGRQNVDRSLNVDITNMSMYI